MRRNSSTGLVPGKNAELPAGASEEKKIKGGDRSPTLKSQGSEPQPKTMAGGESPRKKKKRGKGSLRLENEKRREKEKKCS